MSVAVLTRCAGTVALCLALAGCSSSPAASSHAGNGSALSGDGKWHAVAAATPAAGDFALPPVMNRLPALHALISTGPAGGGFLDTRAFEEVNAEPCAATQGELTKDAGGFTTIASGSSGRVAWLTLADANGEGVSLTLADTGKQCFVEGLPFTSVTLEGSGATAGSTRATAAVSCAIGNVHSVPALFVTIFGAMVGQTPVDLYFGVSPPVAGTYTITPGDQTSHALLYVVAAHSWLELGSTHPEITQGGGTDPPAYTATGGKITIAPGLASGGFDFVYSDGELKGAFECGTIPSPASSSAQPSPTP
jgi:hypothetical protein